MTVADAHAVEATARRGYRPDIQGLRAIAILVVVAFHAGLPLPGGFIGVDMFFVISGFVITSALTRRLTAGSAQLGRFYLSRVRRLFPALAVMLTVVLLASMLLGAIGAMGITARTGGAAALLNANTYLMLFDVGGYFDSTAAVNPLIHTWSLSVEEQFYLVFPGLLALGWFGLRRARGGEPIRREQTVLVLILAASFGLAMYLAWKVPNADAGSLWGRVNYYSAFTRAWEFAAGGLLAVTPALLVRGRRSAILAGCTGLLAVVVGLLVIHENVVFPNLLTLLPVVGTALLISAGTHESGNPVSRFLAVRPMIAVGNLSYSWYLWHWPFIVFASLWFVDSRPAVLGAAAVSLGAAWLSLRLIENPIRYRPRPRRRSTILIGIACVLVPLTAAVVLGVWGSKLKADYTLNPFALHQDSLLDCDSPQSLAHKPSACTWAVPDAKGRAVLVGDSLAGQYSEAFIAGMNANGLTAQIATLSGCPFVDFAGKEKKARAVGLQLDPVCAQFGQRTLAELLADPPDVLVLSSSAQRFLPGSYAAGSAPPTSDEAARAAFFVQERTQMLQKLRDAGISVAVIDPLTKFPGWGPLVEGPFKQSPAAIVLTRGSDYVPALPRATVDANLAPARAAEEAAAAATGTMVLDFIDDVCTADTCSARNGDTWTYRDFEHLTVATSRALIGAFQEAGATLMAARG